MPVFYRLFYKARNVLMSDIVLAFKYLEMTFPDEGRSRIARWKHTLYKVCFSFIVGSSEHDTFTRKLVGKIYK